MRFFKTLKEAEQSVGDGEILISVEKPRVWVVLAKDGFEESMRAEGYKSSKISSNDTLWVKWQDFNGQKVNVNEL